MHLKVFVKLEKNLKTLSSGQKTQKKTNKPKKPKKNQKTHWAGFFIKNRVFSNPEYWGVFTKRTLLFTWDLLQGLEVYLKYIFADGCGRAW
jgi:hypothetical protein